MRIPEGVHYSKTITIALLQEILYLIRVKLPWLASIVPIIGLLYTNTASAYQNAALCVAERTESTNTEGFISSDGSLIRAAAGMCLPPTITVQTSKALAIKDAQKALRRARSHAKRGEIPEALLQYRMAEWAAPTLIDRFALERAELLMKEKNYSEACRAYALARQGPESTIASRARVGHVRCLLRKGYRNSEKALELLVRRYPDLPETPSLRFELAKAKESWEDLRGAAAIYKQIDLYYPGSEMAVEARTRIDELKQQRVRVLPYTLAQRISRTERLLKTGPLDMAHDEVEALRNTKVSPTVRNEVLKLAVTLHRLEGHQPRTTTEVTGAEYSDRSKSDIAMERIRNIVKRRPPARLRQAQLKAIVQIAASAGLVEPIRIALTQLLRTRKPIHPGYRFEVATTAAGIGPDELVAEFLEPLFEVRRYAIGARYHHGRCLERLGRLDEAQKNYREVINNDTSHRRYYSMWARQRFRAVTEQLRQKNSRTFRPKHQQTMLASASNHPILSTLNSIERAPRHEWTMPTQRELNTLAKQLRALVEKHQEGFPWLERAAALTEMGEVKAATDELHEVYRAWRQAIGRKPLRSGLASVYAGKAISLGWPSPAIRQARRKLDITDRRNLADIAAELGDFGTSISIGGWEQLDGLPRAYEIIVKRVAKRRGLDPNLLLAVMRVESVYQPSHSFLCGRDGSYANHATNRCVDCPKYGSQELRRNRSPRSRNQYRVCLVVSLFSAKALRRMFAARARFL